MWGSGKLLQNLKSSHGPWELKSTVGMPLQEQCQAEHRCLGAGCTGFAFWSISGTSLALEAVLLKAASLPHLSVSPEVLTEGHLV